MCAALRRARNGNDALSQSCACCSISNRRARTGDPRVPGDNSHFRQHSVILAGYLACIAADLCGPLRAGRGTQREMIMDDEDSGFSAAGQAWMAWPTDVGQTAAAVIAITRHEWNSRGNGSPSPDEVDAGRTRFKRPLFRLVLDAQSSRPGATRTNRARSGRGVTRKFVD